MKDSIIQRCPKCGKWCITSGKNAWLRFAGDTIDAADTLGELGDRFLGKPGKLVGKIWGGYSGACGGVFNAIVGDRYQFICPRCGCKWSTNDDTKDDTNAYDHWKYRRQKCLEWQSITISKNPSIINSYIKLLSSELNEDDIDEERATPRFVNMVSVDVEAYAAKHFNKAVKKTLTIPQWLNEAALAKNINFSKALQTALMRELNIPVA